MKRIKILHRTYYNFSAPVDLGTHFLRLRPRESHQLRIESATLTLSPEPITSWKNDIEGNSITRATFRSPTTQLVIESDIVVQQYNENPFDFLIEEYAIQFPFAYDELDWPVLSPYATGSSQAGKSTVADWASTVWNGTDPIETLSLLLRIALRIQTDFQYIVRDEPGVQPPDETLSRQSGSCRDFAAFFIAVTRHFGLAARFVSGYLVAEPSNINYGATHAWTEVYLPGAGWTGIDPTLGIMSGSDHIAVAVSHLSDSVPPVAGSYSGNAIAEMNVGVWVTPL
jgi:transglutaminase-like putative cysteine protease